MTGRPFIEVRIGEAGHLVDIGRGPGVGDDFWRALPVRLGAVGRATDSAVQVPIERFLARRLWLREHCISHDVELQLDNEVKNALQRARADRELLADLTSHSDSREEAVLELPIGRFIRRLRPFQIRDLSKLLALPNGANFSVPGAGKTAVTYAVYESEHVRGLVGQLLVVAPLSAFESWVIEAGECFRSLPRIHVFDGSIPWNAEVVLINYQKLKDPYLQAITEWARRRPTHIVLDEAHRMKRGQAGEWGRACLDLAHVAARRDILTGTPAPHSPRDFVALLNFLWPNGAKLIMPPGSLESDPSPGSMTQTSRALAPFFVRTTKHDLDLPKPKIAYVPVRLGRLQADIYDALRNQYAGLFDLRRSDRTMLAQMGEVTMYLLEAATNPALLLGHSPGQGAIPFRYPSLAIPPGSDLASLVREYHLHEVPAKFRMLIAMITQLAASGRKVLVWSNFVGNLLALERLLSRFQPAIVYGAIPVLGVSPAPGVRSREGELARFRTDPNCSVLLANPAAIGEGISLHQVCHDAIYLDRTFNAGQYLQSLDRIHRLGLPHDSETRITILTASKTIDERVDDRVAVKAERLGLMLDDPALVTMALPDEDEYGEVLEDVDDLEALLGHLRDDE